MSRATPQLRHLAKQLMVYEKLGSKATEAETPVAFPVNEKLRPHLSQLMGKAGFRALLSRALALANHEVPWLRAVHVKADGALEGVDRLRAEITPSEFIEGRVELLAQLLGLLIAFIGTNLTLHLVGEVWPHVPLHNLNFGDGGKK